MAFKDIIGQEVPKKLLQTQIRTNRIGTSYLFYGTEGIGKVLTAKTFAKAINCEENKEDSCDVCPTCKGIEELKNPDFVLLTPEVTPKGNKSIGIDQIRAIKVSTSYCTSWLRFRVIIIREADTLTEEASNAFLKILEETPTRTIFILTTSKIDAILPTVRSRCQQIEFKRLKPVEIRRLVPEVPEFILRLSNGSVTRTLKLMEPETQEIRNSALQFLTSSSTHRMQMVYELEEIEEFLLAIQELYMDLLKENLGAIDLIKNSDFELNKQLPVLEILRAITVCEKAFYAFSHNVHKKLILYWLSKELS